MKVLVDDLNALPHKKLKLDFNERLDLEELVKPVLGEIYLVSSLGGVRITGRVKTLLKLGCHVCLRPYFQTLNVEIDEQFVARFGESNNAEPREKELNRDDFYETLPDDGVLDISDVVYQAVTLASPVFHRCGSECPGPPSVENSEYAGVSTDESSERHSSEKIDPRWENLKTLFPGEESPGNS